MLNEFSVTITLNNGELMELDIDATDKEHSLRLAFSYLIMIGINDTLVDTVSIMFLSKSQSRIAQVKERIA